MVTQQEDLIFGALSDPVRREIVTLLASGPRPVTPLAECFDISRPAVSRHLRVLREAGLVTQIPRGRERIYQLDETAMRAAEASLRSLWRGRLQALKQLAEEAQG